MAGTIKIFDRTFLRTRLRRAETAPATFLIERVASDLAERLGAVTREFAICADIGTPAPALRKELLERGLAQRIVTVAPNARGPGWAVAAHEDALPLADNSIDLAVSALSLQFVNDLPGALVQVRRALKPDGLFLAALAGGETLTELRQAFAQAESEIEGGASPRVAPFADLRDLGALMQRAGFALPVTDLDRIVVRYADAFALVRDLRFMGATNVLVERSRKPLRRRTLLRMAEIYAERFADADGRLRATFEIAWLTGWAPHESQQQPLKPGSARARLADALGTAEIPAGEKTGR